MDGWSYQEEILIKTNLLSKDTWKLVIYICILIMVVLLQLSSKDLPKQEWLLEVPYNRQLSSQFAGQKLGIQKSFLLHGGSIMTKYLNRPQQDNICQQALSWSEAKEIFCIQIGWKWDSLSYTNLTMNHFRGSLRRRSSWCKK